MQTLTRQFYVNKKTFALGSQILFPINAWITNRQPHQSTKYSQTQTLENILFKLKTASLLNTSQCEAK